MKLRVFLLLALYHQSSNSQCHPECTWQCSDPICPALCEINCNEGCSTTACDNAGCTCSSFIDTSINNCPAPLDSPCPVCDVTEKGQGCQNLQGDSCQCELSCEQYCTWDCQTPNNCPKPTCELQCEKPACEANNDFLSKKPDASLKNK